MVIHSTWKLHILNIFIKIHSNVSPCFSIKCHNQLLFQNKIQNSLLIFIHQFIWLTMSLAVPATLTNYLKAAAANEKFILCSVPWRRRSCGHIGFPGGRELTLLTFTTLQTPPVRRCLSKKLLHPLEKVTLTKANLQFQHSLMNLCIYPILVYDFIKSSSVNHI